MDSSAAAPPIVLDTNVVLDCWLFEAPASQPLRRAVEAGRLRWLATGPMLDELAHVLARPLGARWELQRERLHSESRLLALASVVPAVACPPCSAGSLRCSDPDDQKFLDAALHERARWLVSRDRALLKLRRRAWEQGLAILEPSQCAAFISRLGELLAASPAHAPAGRPA
jgi:putative PIN family toxin of toxin-antitoxin system